jgi:hypothetical protein
VYARGMKLLSQSPCVLLPRESLSDWVSATPEARRAHIGLDDFGGFDLGGRKAWYFRRTGSALHPAVALRPKQYVAIVISAETDEDIRFAIEEPDDVLVGCSDVELSGGLILLAAGAAVAPSTPDAAARLDDERYELELEAGHYQVEARTSGPGRVVTFERRA